MLATLMIGSLISTIVFLILTFSPRGGSSFGDFGDSLGLAFITAISAVLFLICLLIVIVQAILSVTGTGFIIPIILIAGACTLGYYIVTTIMMAIDMHKNPEKYKQE